MSGSGSVRSDEPRSGWAEPSGGLIRADRAVGDRATVERLIERHDRPLEDADRDAGDLPGGWVVAFEQRDRDRIRSVRDVTWSRTAQGSTPEVKSTFTVRPSSRTAAVSNGRACTSAMPGVGSTTCGWMTGDSSSGHGVNPTEASGPVPFVTVVPHGGVAVPVPGDGWVGSPPTAPGAERPDDRSCVDASDPAAEVAATAQTMTLMARTSEIVTVFGTCASLIGAVQRFLPDVPSTPEAASRFPLQPGPSRTDTRR
jgi:hypothetical protein